MNNNDVMNCVVGNSDWSQRVIRQILQAARYPYPVLIQAAEGSETRQIARAIHTHGACATRFVPFRCGQLPAVLTAQQLFGHAPGTSRWATGAAMGAIGAARGGTLYVQDVDRLDHDSQRRLLEHLQTRDMRVIASTTADLRQEVRDGRFLLELFYSLTAIRLEIPPLCERVDDIVPLAHHWVSRLCFDEGLPFRPITAAAAALLEAHAWPGNLDELRDELATALRSTPDSEAIDLFDFPRLLDAVDVRYELVERGDLMIADCVAEPVNALESIPPFAADPGWASLQDAEARHIADTLRHTGYRLAVAARLLKIDVPQLQAKIRHHKLSLPARITALRTP